jgi:hypothetical protein
MWDMATDEQCQRVDKGLIAEASLQELKASAQRLYPVSET